MKLLDKFFLPLSMALVLAIASLTARFAIQVNAPAPEGIALPIVMYHHILKESSRLNAYTISPEEFRMDLQFLQDNHYTPIVIQDLLDFVQGKSDLPDKPVMITFDDGYESFHEYAYPILQEFGFPAVFSVVGTYADQYSAVDDHHIRYSHCTWEQLRQMHEEGLVEIQNHSYNLHLNQNGRHGSMRKQGESEADYTAMLIQDLSQMQQDCAEQLGWLPTCFTYPFGQISPEALPILKQLGFSAALTCREKINYLTGDPEQLYHLHRFNRPHNTSFQAILQKAAA
ncbi:MAG: polysaccharide deacetylase family protein [Anaerotruncus sp.]|jgi:peptidoglycan/xylan/chitin deacetylase (PgdA/CDA1 family)|nr:polysaccharide deacetylase family protein [Anaerotruncus sp.]